MTDFLRVDTVSKHFGGLRAVDEVSFDLAQGTLTAIIGPNGAGKTTLFNLVAGALPTTRGEVRFLGRRVRNQRGAYRLGLARTFQNVRLFPQLSVLENVLVGMGDAGFLKASLRLPQAVTADRLRMKRAYYLLEEVGLAEQAEAPARDLPFGRQRLLEIARALAISPKLLLLDEPAAGLNRTETTALAAHLRRLHGTGITLLLVEHDMHLVMNLVQRAIVLDQGRLIADGAPAEVRADPAVRAAYLGAAPC